MNVERLHHIMRRISTDVENSQLLSLFANLANTTSQLVSNPSDAGVQTNLASSRAALEKVWDGDYSAGYPRSWINLLEEMGIIWFIPVQLKVAVTDAFFGNELTPAASLEQINKINNELIRDKEIVDGLLRAFNELGIGAERLEPGESEVSVSIPHSAIDSSLVEFGKEVGQIENMFRPFAELVTGSVQPLKVKTISSSDLVVTFMVAAGTICASAKVVKAIADAVSSVINAYADVLKLRQIKADLAELEGSDEVVKEAEKLAEKMVKKEIDKAAKKLVSEYNGQTKGRRNELENSLRINMQKLARRVDLGWGVETRMGNVEEPSEDSDDEEAKQLHDTYTRISEIHEEQQRFSPQDEPILGLPEPDGVEEEA